MSVSSRITLASILALTVCGSSAPLLAQFGPARKTVAGSRRPSGSFADGNETDETDESEDAEADAGQDESQDAAESDSAGDEQRGEDAQTIDVSEPEPRGEGAFPSAVEVELSNPTLLLRLPPGPYSHSSDFPWIKFSIIALAAYVWLQSLRLCAEERLGAERSGEAWTGRVLGIGFVGLLAAVFVPAYLVGAGILMVTCALPLWFYVRWHNTQVGDSEARLTWKRALVGSVGKSRKSHPVEVRLSSGERIGSASHEIVLLGKSVTSRRDASGLHGEARHSPGFEVVMALLDHAISQRATDLHVNTRDTAVSLRLRIDGQITPLGTLPIELGRSVINVFKVLSDLNIADKRRSQDGSFRADVNGRRLYFRVSSQGMQSGEKLSIRILDPAQNLSEFSDLGMTDRVQERLKKIFNRGSGLVLFVGATGAGKSTTSYAALRFLDSGERNIVTIEDPIEYNIPTIDQIEVNVRAGQTFQSALRSVLRQDADVVLVGEIRDEETAQVACQAATTGQLVLATLHANDSVSALIRTIELRVDPHIVSSALRAVLAQTLVRKLCTACRVPYTPDVELLNDLGIPDFRGELYRQSADRCVACNDHGYLGRTAIFEFLEIQPSMRELIRDRARAAPILAAARAHGLSTLWEDGLRLVCDGVTSVEELRRVADDV